MTPERRNALEMFKFYRPHHKTLNPPEAVEAMIAEHPFELGDRPAVLASNDGQRFAIPSGASD
jgi:hypothetical protein